MRGRKPKPTVLKTLHGNPGKRAMPKREPIPAGALVEAPDWLPEDARESWLYAMANAPRGLLRKIDRGILAGWCVAESLHRKAVMQQDAIKGLVYKPKGSDVFLPSPYLAIINKQLLLMVKTASELGFSPAARPRIQSGAAAPPPAGKDMHDEVDTRTDGPPPFAQFLASNPDAPTHH